MTTAPTMTVTPLKPPAPYCGGKSRLATSIIERIDAIPHQVYVEPFVGLGGVFFRRRHRPKAEVVNDYSGDVANFFRIMQRHAEPLLDLLAWQLTCRASFERLQATDPTTLTDLERAARFLFLQRTTFGGNVVGQSFGVVKRGRSANFNHLDLRLQLTNLSQRLAGVVIENLNYDEILRRYDGPHTFFYLDPPYWGTEHCYGRHLFGRDDFAKLAALLANLEGRFVLSLNDRPEVRKLFADFGIEPVTTQYSKSRRANRAASELLISNC